MRQRREDHCEVIPQREEKLYRQEKQKKPSSCQSIFTLNLKALAKV